MKHPGAHARSLYDATNILTLIALVSLAVFEYWHLANRTIYLQHVGYVAYRNAWATLANVIAIVSVLFMVALVVLASRKYTFRSINSSFRNRVVLTLLLVISIGLVATGVVATNKAKDHAGLCATFAKDYSYYSYTYNCPGSY